MFLNFRIQTSFLKVIGAELKISLQTELDKIYCEPEQDHGTLEEFDEN